MATKYYTWSPIRTDSGVVETGTVVLPKDFGADWKDLVECGAIRTKPYPKMPATWQGSVKSFRNEQLRKLNSEVDLDLDDLFDEEEEEAVAL
jgi:hypothetical protein